MFYYVRLHLQNWHQFIACLHVHFSELVLGYGVGNLLSYTQKSSKLRHNGSHLELLPEVGRLQFQKV